MKTKKLANQYTHVNVKNILSTKNSYNISSYRL